MGLTLHPLGPTIGAEVEGLDMSLPLTDQQHKCRRSAAIHCGPMA